MSTIYTIVPQTKCWFCEGHRHDECIRKDADGKLDLYQEPEKCSCWSCYGMFKDEQDKINSQVYGWCNEDE